MSDEDSNTSLVLSCEHASAWIPAEYKALFRGGEAVVDSHRGWDPGAIQAAERFQTAFACPLFQGRMNRLLIELNRSVDSQSLWSEFSQSLTAVAKEALLRDVYHPYRAEVEAALRGVQARHGTAVHLSIHSLTPELNGQRREFDIALLFDPQRSREARLCETWARQMQARDASLVIAFNTPYKGTDDGLVESFRHHFDEEAYIGLEIEYNQALLIHPSRWQEVVSASVSGFPHSTS
ncbi:MAG: N-formylglutamate amidohydrolase [Opitutales bacterium]|nr:N-formylglutamate amidohydrolase [Opitutales bacterium]